MPDLTSSEIVEKPPTRSTIKGETGVDLQNEKTARHKAAP